ncbi:uncharacterized protein ACOB8E_020726 isoform 3-T4 [Sarcophilus harrisii]
MEPRRVRGRDPLFEAQSPGLRGGAAGAGRTPSPERARPTEAPASSSRFYDAPPRPEQPRPPPAGSLPGWPREPIAPPPLAGTPPLLAAGPAPPLLSRPPLKPPAGPAQDLGLIQEDSMEPEASGTQREPPQAVFCRNCPLGPARFSASVHWCLPGSSPLGHNRISFGDLAIFGQPPTDGLQLYFQFSATNQRAAVNILVHMGPPPLSLFNLYPVGLNFGIRAAQRCEGPQWLVLKQNSPPLTLSHHVSLPLLAL